MIKAVLDTNVLASGFSSPSAAPGQLLAAWLAGVFSLAISQEILAELVRTLHKPYFLTRLGQVQIRANLALLRSRASITPLTIQVQNVATHPEDDLILSTAISAQADYLVTGDIQLQKLGTFRGVKIVGPSEFVQILAQVAGPE